MEEKVTFPSFVFRNLYVEFLPLAPLFILCSGHLVCELLPVPLQLWLRLESGLGFYLAKFFVFLLYRAAPRHGLIWAEDYLLLEVKNKIKKVIFCVWDSWHPNWRCLFFMLSFLWHKIEPLYKWNVFHKLLAWPCTVYSLQGLLSSLTTFCVQWKCCSQGYFWKFHSFSASLRDERVA